MWAVALEALEADTCGGCGHPLSETTDASAEDSYRLGLPIRCHACDAWERHMDPIRRGSKQAPIRAGALRYPIERSDDG